MATRTTDGPLLAGRYRVIKRLGAGGMAAVYLAHDERLDRNVAVKRLHTGGGDDMDARRFEREAKLGASLSHPNLVSIFDAEQDDESVLLVMEYVEGETLADLLERGPVEPRRAVEIVKAVAEALDHAHSAGIVHRDVKPGNVLLGRDGSVKLADLGIAKAIERTDITGTGTVLGTPAYMAPEQLEGAELGPAVDIYALAAMAFEMLTGQKARRGRTAVEIAHQVVNEPPPDPRDANPATPDPAAEAIRAGMAKDAAARPRTAVELADRLDSSVGRATTRRMQRARPVATAPVTPRAAPAVTRAAKRDVRWVAIAALLVMAVAAGVIALASGGGDDPPERTAGGGGEERAEKRDRAQEGTNPAPAAPATESEQETDTPPPLAGVPVPSGPAGSAEAAAEAEQLHLDGHAALEAGDYNTAIELNTAAIEAFPQGTTWETDMNYAYALYSLGRALRLAGRPDEAIPVLEARLQVPNQTGTVQNELDLARADAAE